MVFGLSLEEQEGFWKVERSGEGHSGKGDGRNKGIKIEKYKMWLGNTSYLEYFFRDSVEIECHYFSFHSYPFCVCLTPEDMYGYTGLVC